MLQRYSTVAYSLMRIVAGLLFACHGAQKLFGALGGPAEFHDPEGLAAGLIEFFGGSLISLGVFTPIAAFVACGEMAVAYFKAHAPRGVWPILNRGELAALYCFVFLFIACQGDGHWSVRALWVRRFRNRDAT
jgi:putative oxidoreductase